MHITVFRYEQQLVENRCRRGAKCYPIKNNCKRHLYTTKRYVRMFITNIQSYKYKQDKVYIYKTKRLKKMHEYLLLIEDDSIKKHAECPAF